MQNVRSQMLGKSCNVKKANLKEEKKIRNGRKKEKKKRKGKSKEKERKR